MPSTQAFQALCADRFCAGAQHIVLQCTKNTTDGMGIPIGTGCMCAPCGHFLAATQHYEHLYTHLTSYIIIVAIRHYSTQDEFFLKRALRTIIPARDEPSFMLFLQKSLTISIFSFIVLAI